jgi:hypothetical protein
VRRIDNQKPFAAITDEVMELLGTGRQTLPFTLNSNRSWRPLVVDRRR